MAAYLVTQTRIDDPGYRETYIPKAIELITRHGGEIVAASRPEYLEGSDDLCDMGVVIRFPDAEKAKAFNFDPEYAPFMALRNTSSETRATLIDEWVEEDTPGMSAKHKSGK